MFTVYCITSIDSEKSYIGQTSLTPELRWFSHKKEAKRSRSIHKNIHFQNAIRKYGYDRFYIQTLCIAETKEEINNLERLWILSLDTRNPEFGYNMTPGGTGGKPSEENIIKHSVYMKQKWQNPEYKKNMSLAHEGHMASDETKKKMAARTKARWQNPEYRNRACKSMSVAAIKRYHGDN